MNISNIADNNYPVESWKFRINLRRIVASSEKKNKNDSLNLSQVKKIDNS